MRERRKEKHFLTVWRARKGILEMRKKEDKYQGIHFMSEDVLRSKNCQFSPQQNNMAYYQQASYQHQQLFTKNNKLYQQLLHDDLSAPSAASHHNQAATIRFARPAPTVGVTRNPQYAQQRQDFSPKLPRSGGQFKGFEPSVGRMSNQATQSLSSNYCITENENEENSTVNLYSLSRNHIEPDLDLSRQPTAQIDPDQSHHSQAHPQLIPNSAPILEASLLNNTLERQEESDLDADNMKKYRSEDYSHLPYMPQEEEEEGKVPKVLAQKYLKNDITKKFSTGNNSEHDIQSNFKTVLNEIHIVPYRINNQLKPYAYSLPIDNHQYSAHHNYTTISSNNPDPRREKANSLNLRGSSHSGQEEEATNSPVRHLYFSNHTHLSPTRQPYMAHSPHSETPKARQTPRSEPKYNCSNTDRNNRSNSIECKSKPNVAFTQEQESTKNPEMAREHLDQSHVTKVFKNSPPVPLEEQLLPQEASVIYESTGLSICCSLTRELEQHPAPSKINFVARPREEGKKEGKEESPFFVSSIDMAKASPLLNPKGPYKINPIQMIRQLSEPQGQRGIKLVGFPKINRA